MASLRMVAAAACGTLAAALGGGEWPWEWCHSSLRGQQQNPAFAPRHFHKDTIVALRVGDGSAPLVKGTTAAAYLDEIDLFLGLHLQALPLAAPKRPMTCTIEGLPANQVGGITLSAEGIIAVPCWDLAEGVKIKPKADTRNALTVDVNGNFHDQPYTYPSTTHASLFTIHGDWVWGTSKNGLYAVAPTGGVKEEAIAVSSTDDWYRGLSWFEGTLYALRKTEANEPLTQPPIFAVGGVNAPFHPPPTSSPAPEPVSVPGRQEGAHTGHHSFVFESATSLWVTNSGGQYTLWHFVLVSGTWEADAGFPITTVAFKYFGKSYEALNARGVVGFKHLSLWNNASSTWESKPLNEGTGSGWVEHYSLVVSTGTTEEGWLLRFNTVTKEWFPLHKACKGTLWHGLAMSPYF